MRGLALPEVLAKVCHANFERLVGARPRLGEWPQECDRQARRWASSPAWRKRYLRRPCGELLRNPPDGVATAGYSE